MSLLWVWYQAGVWTQTAGCILGRIMLNMNSSRNPWWVVTKLYSIWCIDIHTMYIILHLVYFLFEPNHLYSHHFMHWQDFFPDHMVSISSETNGMVDHSQLIEVSSSLCLQCTLFAHEFQVSQPLFKCAVVHWEYTAYTHLWTNISLPNTDLSQLQHLSRDPWTSPCQRTKQKILEEVLFCAAEVRAVFFQQGNFKGQLNKTAHQQNVVCSLRKSKSQRNLLKTQIICLMHTVQTVMLHAVLFTMQLHHNGPCFTSWIKST